MSNFSQVIQTAKVFGELLPVASSLVQAIEGALPTGTPGATKLDAVRVAISSVYSTIEGEVVSFEQVWPMLQPMISGFVTVFNRLGLFHHSTPAPVAAPADPVA